MVSKVKRGIIILAIIVLTVFSYSSYDFYSRTHIADAKHVGMLSGIDKNSEQLKGENYYTKLYHESNFPDVQNYNIICIHNNNQVSFKVNGNERFVHYIECEPYSKNYYDVQIPNIKDDLNDFIFLLARDPYGYYDEPIIPQKLNIANRSILSGEHD